MGLEDRAQRLEEVALSPNQPSAAKTAAAQEAAVIRRRLAEGDFKVGDRILLLVEGEPSLSDTFTVGLGSSLILPAVGEVSLVGVLRSELQNYLARRLGQNLRDPVVRARAYVRLSIDGAVARPGFYGVPADALLSDALMAAGGPTPEAQLGKLRIERAGRPIWEGRALQQAIAAGKTIDDAGLIAGDQYVLPRRGRTTPRHPLRFGGGSGAHAHQTATIMERFEPVCIAEAPDLVRVYGDVNSTVAAALVAAKLGTRVGHVEAGLRSRDRTMPEGLNRIVTDQLADILFAPSRDAIENLCQEGIPVERVHFVGNVMTDSLRAP